MFVFRVIIILILLLNFFMGGILLYVLLLSGLIRILKKFSCSPLFLMPYSSWTCDMGRIIFTSTNLWFTRIQQMGIETRCCRRWNIFLKIYWIECCYISYDISIIQATPGGCPALKDLHCQSSPWRKATECWFSSSLYYNHQLHGFSTFLSL